MSLQLYHALSKLNKIKRKELVLPIAKRQVVVSPLSVGDDLVLKTALISPVKLDRELIKLLWMHTEFWFPNDSVEEDTSLKNKKKKTKPNEELGGEYRPIKEKDFYTQISYYDKLMILWGIYNITYVSLGRQEIECPNCGEKHVEDIVVDETMHEDSITIFDEDVPFNKFTDHIILPFGDDYELDFTVCIPSMADFNRILGMVSIDELQSNLENIRSQFNTEQLMTLYTKNLAVYRKDNPSEKFSSSVSQEILSSIRDFVNIDISTAFFSQYSSKFSKYNVNFYKNIECPNCKNVTKMGVDIEYNFFRKQLPS